MYIPLLTSSSFSKNPSSEKLDNEEKSTGFFSSRVFSDDKSADLSSDLMFCVGETFELVSPTSSLSEETTSVRLFFLGEDIGLESLSS